jgi:phosphoglycerate dehydrogenase-like enzyme
VKIWIPHDVGVPYLSGLPDGVEVEVADDPGALPSDPAGVRFWVPGVHAGRLAARLPDLRVVQLAGEDVDGWPEAVAPGVILCTTRGVHDAAVAEWVVATILASYRTLPAFVRAQQARRWAREESRATRSLSGRRVLIAGAGSVGAALAERLEPFGVRMTMVADMAGLPALLPGADIVVLLVPLTAATAGLVDDDFLAALPDGALLVNAARGPVVQRPALHRALSTGRISAVLDVTDPQPLPAHDPLWALPNVIITPQVGATTREVLDRTYRFVAGQVGRFLAGRPLANHVRRPQTPVTLLGLLRDAAAR